MTTTKKGVIRTVLRRRARFCNDGCADSFRSDRQHGIFYPPMYDKPPSEGGTTMPVERASIQRRHCCYCNTDLKST
jgi:hypothetical protein